MQRLLRRGGRFGQDEEEVPGGRLQGAQDGLQGEARAHTAGGGLLRIAQARTRYISLLFFRRKAHP